MRLIDADALKTKAVYSKERHEKVVPVADIDWMPTVDAVPVVNCKDCIHNKSCMWSEPDWFCADGKRKEQNDE